MQNKTLLDLVQSILRSTEGDEVNSIFDTQESTDIAYAVRESYENLVLLTDRAEQKELFELTAYGPVKPVLATLPQNVLSLDWLKYDCKDSSNLSDPYSHFTTMTFLPLPEYLNLMYSLPSQTDTNIGTFNHLVDGSNIEIFFWKNKNPTYYTSLNDKEIIFDSFDFSLETNIQNQKTLGYGKKSNQFLMEDSFVIPLNQEHYQLLLQDAKSQVFVEQKQMEHGIANKRARAIRIRNQNHGNKINADVGYTYDARLPNYGRK